MACLKCGGRLNWEDRAWTTAGEDPGHWSCLACGEVVYPEEIGLPGVTKYVPAGTDGISTNVERGEVPDGEGDDTMAYHLRPEKEKEVKGLLKDHSVREIVAKTGVAKNTILRIRNEDFTAGERKTLKKLSLIKGRNKRELEKEGPGTDLQNDRRNIHEIIPLNNSGEKGGQEMTRTDKGKECTRKKCKRRGQILPFEEFNKNKATPDGYEYHCKVCKAETARARRKRIEKEPSHGRATKNRQPLALKRFVPVVPGPAISDAITLDAQLLRAVKKSAILDFVKNDLPKMVEEAFAQANGTI